MPTPKIERPAAYAAAARDGKELSELYDWFAAWLRANNFTICVTAAEYREGAGALADTAVGAALAEARRLWREGRSYAVSRRQLDVAFFAAARDAGRLVIVPGGADRA